MPGSAPRCRFSAQRSLTAAAETCISMPYSNFWLRRNTAQLRGHGHDGVKIGARQQLGLTLFEPLPGLGSVAFGACPVPAAVVVPERVVAVVAAVEPSPQLWRAAGGDVRKCLLLRGHHPVAVLRSVLGTEPADDVRQLDGRLWRANAGINHGWASFPRRGRRWSGTAACGAGPAAARSGGCRSAWIAGSNGRARSG